MLTLLSGLVLVVLTLPSSLDQVVGALQLGLTALQLLELADASRQLQLLLGIGLNRALQSPLDLMQLLQGLLAGHPHLPQLRVPADQALLQLRGRRLQPLTRKEGLQLGVSLLPGLEQALAVAQIRIAAQQRGAQLKIVITVQQRGFGLEQGQADRSQKRRDWRG